jgi:hypothetical protein
MQITPPSDSNDPFGMDGMGGMDEEDGDYENGEDEDGEGYEEN